MNKLNSSQAKQLREIAAYLKQRRIENSLSLEQIASRTFIRLHILEALEAAQVEQLPELIYVQGFIRRYGEVLQIDGNSLAKRLSQSDHSAVAVETPPPPQPQPQPKPQPKPQLKSPPPPQPKPKPQPKLEPENSAIEAKSSPKLNIGRYWVLITLIACIGASISLLYILSRSPDPEPVANSVQSKTPTQPKTIASPVQKTATQATTPVAANTPSAVASPVESPTQATTPVAANTPSAVASPVESTTQATTPVAANTPSAVASPVESPATQATTPVAANSPSAVASPVESPATQATTPVAANSPSPVASPTSSPLNTTKTPLSVDLALKGTSWLKIQVDGKTEYEGILEEGVQKTWTATEKLTIIAGNAGAVSYSVNKKPAQLLGELGEVKEIKLTPIDNNTNP